MQLFEQGKLRLNDKVTDYIPEFQGGKSGITLRNLFTAFFPVSAGRAAGQPMERLPNRHQASLHGSARRAARRALRL